MSNKMIATAIAEGHTLTTLDEDRLQKIADLARLLNRCDSLNGPIPIGSIASTDTESMQIVRLDPAMIKAALTTLLEQVAMLAELADHLDDDVNVAAHQGHSQKARTRAALQSKRNSALIANRLDTLKLALSAAYQPNFKPGNL